MNPIKLLSAPALFGILCTAVNTSVGLAGPTSQTYQTDFENASPLVGLTQVDYSGNNGLAVPVVVGGRSGGQGVLVGGGTIEGGTGGTSGDTQYPALFLKFPVIAEAAKPFTWSADFKMLDEGSFSDAGFFIGRFSAFNADPSFYHILFNVNDASNGLFYHADHGHDHRGDRPDGSAGGFVGTPTPVAGNLPGGLAVETWYRVVITWSPSSQLLSLVISGDAGQMGAFSVLLNGSAVNPNAPSQVLNAPLPALVQFAFGTFNDGAVVDNVSLSYNEIPPNITGASTIPQAQSYMYAANAGRITARPTSADGVVTTDSRLCGKAYAANFGWVDFGTGYPPNGYHSANSSATDFGVNLRNDGALEGFAYSANTGWIEFEQTQGKPKLDFITGVFSGYAYSANIGWIELGNSFGPLVTTQLFRPDTDGDTISDSWEWQHFGNLTTASSVPPTNRDGDAATDYEEFLADSDPNDSSSNFRIITQTFGANQLSAHVVFTSSPSRLYRIEHQPGLGGTWTDSVLGLFRPAAGSQTTTSLSLPGGANHFLRASAIIPLQTDSP